MMPLPVKLILWLCLSIMALAAEPSSAQTQLDPELFKQAIIHAKEISQSLGYNAGQSLVQQLQEGNIEALYTVAQWETTKEFKVYEKGMGYLDKYAELVREGGDTSSVKHLKAAMKELEQLQKKAGDDMSELQKYLLNIIVGRVQLLMMADGDEL